MSLDDRIALLASAPLIGLLEPAALRLIATAGDVRGLRSNDILFRAGDRSDGGYVVLQGELAIAREQTGAVVLAGPASLVGRIAIFVRTPRSATAVARERSSVLRISPTLMRRVLEEFPTGGPQLREALAEDLDELTQGLERVRGRLLAIRR